MPLTPPPPITNQVLPTPGVLPYVQQQNLGQMIGQVMDWAGGDISPSTVTTMINNYARLIYDTRQWYALMVQGQIASPAQTSGGSVTTVSASNVVTGVGTNFTSALVGQQFRIGFNNPLYTITAVPNATTLHLILPWAGPGVATSGYQIYQSIYTLGPNIKYIKTMVNLLMCWRFDLNWTQEGLNAVDAWRSFIGFPGICAGFPASQTGAYQVELYPAPIVAQAFPFMAYVYPPNLVNDTDSLAPFIRCDAVVNYCIADVLVKGGPKMNKYYDANESKNRRQIAAAIMRDMEEVDEGLYRQNVVHDYESYPVYDPGGATFDAMHAVMSASRG